MSNEKVYVWAFALVAAVVIDFWLLPRFWRNLERTGRLAAARAWLAPWQARWRTWWEKRAVRAKVPATRSPSLAQPAVETFPASRVVSEFAAVIQPAPNKPNAAPLPGTESVVGASLAETPVPPGVTPAAPDEAQRPAEETSTPLPASVPASPGVDVGFAAGTAQVPPSSVAATSTTRVQVAFDLAPGARVRVTVEDLGGPSPAVSVIADQVEKAPTPQTVVIQSPKLRQVPAPVTAPAAAVTRLWPSIRLAGQNLAQRGRRLAPVLVQRLRALPVPLELALFWSALGVYLVTRLVGLDRYPIYFFTDEAVHTVLASNFVRDGFSDSSGVFLPTFFSLGPSFNLNGVSVYLQVLPLLLFGKSVFVTRATSVFITLLGTAAVGLTLRDIFKVRYWWAAVLLLAITPTWFLHSRTAFEYAEVAAFYGGFIYFYLRYRCGSPRWLYGAVVMGALAFYTHGLGEVLILSTAALLFVIDLPYHFKNRAVVGRGFVLALILALPYFRFSLSHSSEFMAQLRQRASYWTNSSLSLAQKLSHFASEYAYGLNPIFWYFPETRDIERHVMKGYGNILWPTLPFALLGLVQVFRKFRQAAYRVILATLLTTPIGSALVAIGVPRMLWFLMPLTVLTALGLSAVMEWLERRRWPALTLSLSLFAVLAGFSFYMLYDALTNGPLWSTDYTLYGMQYGAKQLFADSIPPYLKRDPKVRFEVSPTWANGTDLFIPFFLSPAQQARVQLRNIDYYLSDKQTIDPNAIQVMTPDEYTRAIATPKFKEVKVEQIIPYPDGRPGFYFTRLTYADNVDQVFAAELEARRQLAEGQFTIGGQTVSVRYSQIGTAALQNIFDGNPDTLVRGLDANPFVLEFVFPAPRSVTGISAQFGSMDLTMSVSVYAPGSTTPVKLSQTYRDQPPDPKVEMRFDNAPTQVSKMRVEILNLLAGQTANIHIREFKVLP